jgi:hypothetical protein
LRKNNKARGITIDYFTIYCKLLLLKWYGSVVKTDLWTRETEQGSQNESHLDIQLIFTMGTDNSG